MVARGSGLTYDDDDDKNQLTYKNCHILVGWEKKVTTKVYSMCCIYKKINGEGVSMKTASVETEPQDFYFTLLCL